MASLSLGEDISMLVFVMVCLVSLGPNSKERHNRVHSQIFESHWTVYRAYAVSGIFISNTQFFVFILRQVYF